MIFLQFYLPTGTVIETSRNRLADSEEFISVAIWPGLVDIDKTSGLCGNFDENWNNDGELDWSKWPVELSDADIQMNRCVINSL